MTTIADEVTTTTATPTVAFRDPGGTMTSEYRFASPRVGRPDPVPVDGRRIAIVGTAGDLALVPRGDDWERWAVHYRILKGPAEMATRDAFYQADPTGPRPASAFGALYEDEPLRFDRVYELHDRLTREPECVHGLTRAALNQTSSPGVEVWSFYPDPSWSPSHCLSPESLVETFGRYFTNSVSWMIGHALYAHLQGARCAEIGVYGIQMATPRSEFGHERPSVEYMLGWARGLGIAVTLPDSCDLLHCSNLYGFDRDTWFEHKLLTERQRMVDDLKLCDPNERPYTYRALEETIAELEYLIRIRFHTRPGGDNSGTD